MKQKTFTSYFSRLIFWNKNNKNKPVSVKTGEGAKAFLSKLSGAFLLPISVIAIGGLFLGIGATIASQSSSSAGKTFGEFVKQLGDPLFAVLPLLFAAAIAVSFTEEAGVAVFNAIIGYAIFSALQSVFITDVTQVTGFEVDTLGRPILDNDGNPKAITQIIGYKVLFNGPLRNPSDLKSIIGNSLGFKVLQTSVFGGIIVGFLVQWSYNKFHKIQLPQVISFFGGKRFVAFVVTFLMVPLAFIFLLLWPYIGYGFNWVGKNSGKIPFGFDSFIFGFIERSLVPFGLHHVFYSPLWYTAAGADVASSLNEWIEAGNKVDPEDLRKLADVLKGTLTSSNLISGASVVGDSTTTTALVGYVGNDVHYYLKDNLNEMKTLPLFKFIEKELDLKLGRFLDGKFSFMQWGLPFAGLAMVMAAPKENRKLSLGIILPASLTCFITGVTEPLEFTFLFLAPAMFFGFHAFMCALSFLLMNIFSVHIAQTFSGGFLDLMIYGAVPMMKGTNFWWTFVVGAAYAPIYYFVFYFWIIKADLPTPGRGGNTKLFSKKDYQAQKSNNSQEANGNNQIVDPLITKIIEGFGGKENITKTANCASRLRFDVVNANNVNEGVLKEAGAYGVRKTSNTHVQVIFGPKAEQLKIQIDAALSNLNKNNDNIPVSIQNSSIDNLSEINEKTCKCSNDCSKSCTCEKCHNFNKLDFSSNEINYFKEFVLQFGELSNLLTISKKKDSIYLKFKSISNSNEIKVKSLFDSENFVIEDNNVKLTYLNDEKTNIAIDKIKKSISNLNHQNSNLTSNDIHSPIQNGKLKLLESLNDGVFSEKLLGDGFVVEQSDGNVYSPISGKVIAIFPTGHAYGIQNEDGLNILVHIGVDTVNLNGEGFVPCVQQDQIIKQGELLAKVDLDVIEKNKLISDVIVVVTSDSKIKPKQINLEPLSIVSIDSVIIDKFESM